MNPSLYVESSELLGDEARGILLDFLLIRGAIEKRSGKRRKQRGDEECIGDKNYILWKNVKESVSKKRRRKNVKEKVTYIS